MTHLDDRNDELSTSSLEADQALAPEQFRALSEIFGGPDRAAADRSAAQLAETLEAIYARTGMSEDELVTAFLQAD
jgi:hypothetical protein